MKQNDPSKCVCVGISAFLKAQNPLLFLLFNHVFLYDCVSWSLLVVNFYLHFSISVMIGFLNVMCQCVGSKGVFFFYCNHLFFFCTYTSNETFLSMLLLLFISFSNVLCCGRMQHTWVDYASLMMDALVNLMVSWYVKLWLVFVLWHCSQYSRKLLHFLCWR